MKFLKNKAQKALVTAVTMSLVMGVCGSALAFSWFGQSDNSWGRSDTATASRFKGEWVEGTKGDYSVGNIYGGYTTSSGVDASSNELTLISGTFTYDCAAAYSLNGNANQNTMNVRGGTISRELYAGYSFNGNAIQNTMNVIGGTISSPLYGGYSLNGNANQNTVTVSGGEVNSNVFGGFSRYGEASDNTVNISVSLGSDANWANVTGGTGETANNNTVNLIGNGGKLEAVVGYEGDQPIKKILENKNEDITIVGILNGSPFVVAEGNTLNVAGKNTSVTSIRGFQNLNFYIQDSLTYGDTMVNITNVERTNIKGAKVGVIVEAKPKDNGDDKTINLLKITGPGTITWTDTPKEGENYTIVVKEGAKLTLDNTKNGVALSEDSSALVLTLGGIEAKPTVNMATPAAMPLFEAMDKNKDSLSAGIKNFCENLLNHIDGDKLEASAANVKAAISGAYQASEITGTTSTAVSVVNNVANLTAGRMSLGGSANVGGKGVGLMAPDSGADVWARYVHGKDKADGINMDGGSADYSNNYNGFIVGADFKKVGKCQSGIAFSYVKGSGSNSFKDTMGATARYGHTDFHTYNFGYYGSVKNDDTNTMFDISYGTTSSDSDTNGVGGAQSFSAKSKIFNAGVTAEKSFDVSGMKLVPYTGLRYMHVDGGEYTDSLGIHHRADKQNVFMLPVGLKLSKENKLSHDWTVTPKVDLSYTWNMGDTDSEMTVSVPGLTSSRLGYSVMDTGSFMGVAGVEAQRKNWTYGVSYAYQKGSHQDSKKIIADIKLKF